MNYNRPVKNDSTVTVKAACAVVFAVFTFLWLYFFQADVLFDGQHVLSGGVTTYNRTVGAVLITLLLWLLQLGVYCLTRLSKKAYALTFFPSMLLLAMMTSIRVGEEYLLSSYWCWLVPLLLALWLAVVWIARKVQNYEPKAAGGFFSRRMWVNMLTMALQVIMVTAMGNTHAVSHYRLHAETALLTNDFDEALRVGSRSLETDSSLTMLRMYALSRQGQLPERLFNYPVVSSSSSMLPTVDRSQLLFYPADSIYRHLGAIPRRPMLPRDYLSTIIRYGQAKPAAVDYLLCGYLIDKDIDAFAREIGRYYTVNDSLPRHYREALVLYTHQRSNPVVVFHSPVLDVDYEDFRKLEEAYPLESERRGQLMEHYGNSYWFYYEYVTPMQP